MTQRNSVTIYHTAGITRRELLTGTAALALAIGGSSARPTSAQEGPRPRIAVSTSVFADIVRTIAGDRVEVFSVIPGSVDPHTWEASANDIVRATEADAFIWMGAYLERFVEAGAWRRAIEDADIPQLVLSEHLDLIVRDVVIDHGDHVHDLRDGDPHVWLDPLRIKDMVDVIVPFLSERDPDGSESFLANGTAYKSELDTVHGEYVNGLSVIPPEHRKLVVFHDAFTYFAVRYDFEIVGVVLQNVMGEPSAQEIAELIDLIEGEDVPAVFKEPQFDAKVLDAVADETGVAVGELITDTFADLVDDCLGLLRFNLGSLVTHLGTEP